MSRTRCAALLCALVVAGGCGDKAAQSAVSQDSTAVDSAGAPSSAAPAPGSDGVRFDPANVPSGRRYGDVVVAEATLVQATGREGKPYIGRIRFSGTLDLTGTMVKNPGSVPFPLCFEPDAASAARMPRMLGDTRAITVCFVNADATEMIGEIAPGTTVKVRLSDYSSSYAYDGVKHVAALISINP